MQNLIELKLYEKPAKLEDVKYKILGKPSENLLDKDLERLRQEGKEGLIYAPDWKEITLALDAYSSDPLKLHLSPLSSCMVQAFRGGYEIKSRPAGVLGMTVSLDNKLVLGLRGGKFVAGMIHVVPAGSLVWKEKYDKNPLADSYYEELKDELGIEAEEIDAAVIGHDNYLNDSMHFIIKGKSMLDYKDIEERHRHAKDAFEHRMLIGVENSPDAIQSFLKESEYPVFEQCKNLLELYIESELGSG